MNQYLSFLNSKETQAWAKKGADFFDKFPHLPKKIVDFLVKITPYLILLGGVGMIFSAWGNLTAINKVNRWLSHWGGVRPAYYYISAAFEIMLAIIYLSSWKALRERQYEGWMFLFASSVLSVVQNLILTIFGWQNLFALAIAWLISFWLLYEIRPAYIKVTKKAASTSKKEKKTNTKKKTKK